MAKIETWFDQDLKKAVKVQYIDGNVFSQDNNGNVVGVNVYDNGEPATLGGSVSANIIRADGATVAAVGTLSGNKASVVLPQSAYAVSGVISIVIKLTSGEDVTTLGAVVSNVYQSTTDSIVDPGTIIPSIDALIAEIEAAISSIPADYSALLASIANNYSSSSSYKIGDIVWHDGSLKRCTTTIPTPETWNSSHWTDVVIADNFNLYSMMFRSRPTGETDSRMLKQIGCYNINTSWYTDLTTDFGSNKYGALICFGNPVNSQIYHIIYFETGEMYARWVNKSTASAGAWVYINSTTDWTNVLNLKTAGSITDARLLPVGFYNCNTSWFTDLTAELGAGLIGVLFVYGNPLYQHYQVFAQETGEVYLRWVNAEGTSAGSFVLINHKNVLSLKRQGNVTDSKLLPVGFYNCNTSWFTDLTADLGAGLIGVLFVYGNPLYQHYQMFIQETGDIYLRWVNADGASAGTFIHISKSFTRTNRYFSFGDSRVYGYLAGSGNQSQYRYPKFIADQMGMSYSNYAISGSGLFARNGHQAAIDVVQGVSSLSEATLITIEWGVNDYQQPLGTYTDTTDATWCGRLYQVISYIMQTAPNACLVVIGSANTAEGTFENGWGYGVTTQSGAWSLGKLIDEEAKLCAKYHVPFISGYDSPINDFNIEGLMPDDLHYLDQGYLMRSRYLLGKIKGFFGVNVPEAHSGA